MSVPTDVSPKRAAAMRALLVDTVAAEPEARRRRTRRLFGVWGGRSAFLALVASRSPALRLWVPRVSMGMSSSIA